ncbi:kinase-like protein [Hymenopellis radicata]|nr:kinase-like protein [Hymenopellis radicata]
MLLSPSRPPTPICGSEPSNEAPTRTHSPSHLVNTPVISPTHAVAEGEQANCTSPSQARNSCTALAEPRTSSNEDGLSTRASLPPDPLPEISATEAEAHKTASSLDSDSSDSASQYDCPTPLRLPAGIPHTIVVGNETLHLQALPSSSGSGYGTVLRALANDGKQYGVKILKKPQICLVRPERYFSTESPKGTQKLTTGGGDLFRELAILRKLRDMSPRCPFICDFVEAYQDEHAVYMIMPLYEPLKFDHTISPAEFRMFAFQAVHAIATLHRNGIVHRDIKPDNFVRHTSPSGAKLAVAIDFGLANVGAVSTATPGRLWVTERCGTVMFLPSEMMETTQKELYTPPWDGEKVDVHALGLTFLKWLWAIFHVQPDTENIKSMPDYFRHVRYNPDIRRFDIVNALRSLNSKIADREDNVMLSAAIDLIANMTCTDPSRRFGLEEVKNHAYFEGCRIEVDN